jgi:exopolyphosphatase/guanosine-5'-triphosphate,3'-diphosphate pyrophosphatase
VGASDIIQWASARERSAAEDAAASVTLPLAAVDLGSNSFRLEIGEFQQGRYCRLERSKEAVRLGAGLDADGMLQEDAIQRALDALRGFATQLAPIRGDRVRAVATQTLREARNRDTFLRRAQAVLGHRIEVISGSEEAHLIFAGVALLQQSDRPRFVVDIGGRSTELVLGSDGRPERARSFQMGSASLSMRYFEGGMLRPEAFRAAQLAAGDEFAAGLPMLLPKRWHEALGASGTVGAVSQVLLACGVTDGRITPAALQWFIERCIDARHVDALRLRGLQDDRRGLIGGGLAILSALFAQFGIQELLPAKGSLRHGVIAELQQRSAAEVVEGRAEREAVVRELQQRFAIDTAQACRVRRTALEHLIQVQPEDVQGHDELAWACELHEAGMAVSQRDHHRHGDYLISHAHAPGLSPRQQRRIGRLLLRQRGGLRKLEGDLDDPGFAWRVLCLRLAIILCHTRTDPDAGAVRLHRQGRVARLAIEPVWARGNSSTLHLLRQESQAWQRGGMLALELPGDLNDASN